MGDASVHVARATRPGSLRARFGRDGQRNALHGSDSLKAWKIGIRDGSQDINNSDVSLENSSSSLVWIMVLVSWLSLFEAVQCMYSRT